MNKLLLDSNIVIYLLNGESFTVDWMKKWREKKLFISIITWIEVLAGSYRHKKTVAELEYDLMHFEIIPLRKDIARLSAFLFESLYQKRETLPRFQDGLIAATALAENLPLLTNNSKDFRCFKGLKILAPKK